MGLGPTLAIVLLTLVHFAGIALLVWSIGGRELLGVFRAAGEDDGGLDSPVAPDGPRDRDGGALPLPDARPAPVRLRDAGRLADGYPRRPRRPEHVPAPEREPERA